MEDGGVGEGDVFGGDADKDDARGEAAVLEGLRHRVGGAGGIDDKVGEVAVGEFFEFFEG